MSARPPAFASAAELADAWRERVSKIARNLTDFNESPAALRVKARMDDPATAYQGRTAAAARAALDALDALWRDYLMLSRVVDEADALARKSGLLANHDAEVVALLTSESIKLPSVSVPVQQRGLLDSPERQGRVRPQTVLDSMIRAFDVARSTLAEIDAAETSLPQRAAALQVRARDLAADGLTPPAPPPVDPADPLAAADALAAFETALAAQQAARDALARDIEATDRRLAAAHEALDTLNAATAQARAAAEDAARRFADAPTFHAEDAFAPWLESLRAARRAGRVKSVAIGLDKWDEARRARLAEVEAVAAQAARLAAAHADLAGRLGALRAKGAALPPSPALAALETAAKTELRRTPCHLPRAASAVQAYEDALAGRRT